MDKTIFEAGEEESVCLHYRSDPSYQEDPFLIVIHGYPQSQLLRFT